MEFKKAAPKRAMYKVENLNPAKNIYSSIKSEDKDGVRKYAVVLCISNVVKETVFPSYRTAMKEMERYRTLYRPLNKNSY